MELLFIELHVVYEADYTSIPFLCRHLSIASVQTSSKHFSVHFRKFIRRIHGRCIPEVWRIYPECVWRKCQSAYDGNARVRMTDIPERIWRKCPSDYDGKTITSVSAQDSFNNNYLPSYRIYNTVILIPISQVRRKFPSAYDGNARVSMTERRSPPAAQQDSFSNNYLPSYRIKQSY